MIVTKYCVCSQSEADVLAGLGMVDWHRIRQFVIEVHNVSGRVTKMVTMLKRRGLETKVITTPDTKSTRNVIIAAVRQPTKRPAATDAGGNSAPREGAGKLG